MECFRGIRARTRVRNIHPREDDRELRNEIWRIVSRAAEASRIASLARSVNQWFSKHIPRRRRRASSSTPWKRTHPNEIQDLPAGIGKTAPDKVSKATVATTGKRAPVSPKLRAARVINTSPRQLSVEDLTEDIASDRPSTKVSRDLPAAGDSIRDVAPEEKVYKATIKDRIEHPEIQDFQADWESAPCRLSVEKASFPVVGVKKAAPVVKHVPEIVSAEHVKTPIRPKLAAVVREFWSDRSTVKDAAKATTEEGTHPRVSSMVLSANRVKRITQHQRTETKVSEEWDKQRISTDLTETGMQEVSLDEESEEEYSDSPEWEVTMAKVSGIKGIIRPKNKAPPKVKKWVRFIVEEDQLEDSLSKFLRSQDDKLAERSKRSRPLYRPQHNEAWPLLNKEESITHRPLYRPVEQKPRAGNTIPTRKSETRIRIKDTKSYSEKELVEKSNNNAQVVDEVGENDIDEAIADILRNMGELP